LIDPVFGATPWLKELFAVFVRAMVIFKLVYSRFIRELLPIALNYVDLPADKVFSEFRLIRQIVRNSKSHGKVVARNIERMRFIVVDAVFLGDGEFWVVASDEVGKLKSGVETLNCDK